MGRPSFPRCTLCRFWKSTCCRKKYQAFISRSPLEIRDHIETLKFLSYYAGEMTSTVPIGWLNRRPWSCHQQLFSHPPFSPVTDNSMEQVSVVKSFWLHPSLPVFSYMRYSAYPLRWQYYYPTWLHLAQVFGTWYWPRQPENLSWDWRRCLGQFLATSTYSMWPGLVSNPLHISVYMVYACNKSATMPSLLRFALSLIRVVFVLWQRSNLIYLLPYLSDLAPGQCRSSEAYHLVCNEYLPT